MANYIVSYDLNGSNPSHEDMDEHMETKGWSYARILETVWYVGTSETRKDVYDHINAILSKNDQLIVFGADAATFRNLLVDDASFKAAWQANL